MINNNLSKREIEVLKLICDGKSSFEIGMILFISEPTVSRHRDNIHKKLGLHRAIDVVRYAIREGIIQA